MNRTVTKNKSNNSNEYNELMKVKDWFAYELFMTKATHEFNTVWSFKKIKQKFKDANVSFTYRAGKGKPGKYVTEYPDGSKKYI